MFKKVNSLSPKHLRPQMIVHLLTSVSSVNICSSRESVCRRWRPCPGGKWLSRATGQQVRRPGYWGSATSSCKQRVVHTAPSPQWTGMTSVQSPCRRDGWVLDSREEVGTGRERNADRETETERSGGRERREVYIYKLVCCPPLVNYVEERGVTTLIGWRWVRGFH